MTLYLRVPGRPSAKANQYRIVRIGKHARLAKDTESRAYEERVRKIAEAAADLFAPTRPTIAAGREVTLTVLWHRGDRRRKDTDGIMKGICDGLNKILFADDSQISDLHARRVKDAMSADQEWVDIFVRIS